ncbi:MAG: tRNA (adenosine(37)-N6)-threonylcarbamoyltransferase complex ATPase subunit type 1 TsaE [Flavobacteriia bacterium]|nr:tRNA (adenosine(37)-N6)-threonylcarbamoyltransferase complex ATPase subunit type 1 TsaE [Flavobacteriia bacterium]
MKLTIHSIAELDEAVREILASIPKGVVLFQGPMGAGKTTTISAICRALEVEDHLSSPTFSLVNEYQSGEGESIYHFDFYRIEDEAEAMDMGYEDYFWSGDWCFVEWPEKIPNLLPSRFTLIRLSVENEVRTLEVKIKA